MSRSTEPAPSYIVEAQDPTCGQAATIIFLHGYSDDAEGLPLGLAQQFQMYDKAKYLRWVLPNAPFNREAGTTAWFVPRQLPGGMLPFVPGQVYETEADDDEKGMLLSVDRLDQIVADELAKGTPPDRLIVGGFSQGCVTTLLWAMLGKNRYKVAGLIVIGGYFPLDHRLAAIREERGIKDETEDHRQWYYAHGTKDMIVPPKMFELGKQILAKWVPEDQIETRLFEGMGHSTGSGVLRGMLRFFDRVIPGGDGVGK